MKVYRYMSEKEFLALAAHMPLHNSSRHIDSRTNSAGFCFLGEDTTFIAADGSEHHYTPENCYAFLCGIVAQDAILVEFEADKTLFVKGYGIYADPITDDWDAVISIAEYSLLYYDDEILRPLRYGMMSKYYKGYESQYTDSHLEWYDYH